MAAAPRAARPAAVGAGVLNGSGALVLASSTVTFSNTTSPGGGVFLVDPSSSGSFAVLGGTFAILQALDSTTEPAGTTVSVANWLAFAAAPTWTVTLTEVLPGVFSAASCAAPAAAGQVCTPAGSPMSFTNLGASSSQVTFAIQGTAVNVVGFGVLTPVTAVFTAQFPDRSYQNVLSALGGGGSVSSTYSVTFQ